ncbi:molybdenum cofactor biosynthesis protein MoaE [Rhodovulum sp. FJ3]|uniref:molybdenum cofactor biosynthesis protein MoaE n=1 Tax=Rhodovulum sp. FJ3 TaxID=3079053 RepID=UPI00293DF90E|nr:molybdenum cofactor biosynthesis protein MoaE [Rhodovulum sp. FJ3]MDV4169533.1 molybdenum cofactor biosynthesis protein MoaE [Rhodovulum sp. FJ3]
MTVRVQEEPFDFGAEANAFATGRTDAGAVVTFTGIVRDLARGDLDRMVIEHYPGMTERALEKIEADARARWDLRDVLIIHRYGAMGPGDMIMMVATASPHRVDAFEAAEFLMDFLKSRAPFWKKEITQSGEEWVASKAEDEDALSRW